MTTREDMEQARVQAKVRRELTGGSSAACLKVACPTCWAAKGKPCMSPPVGKRPAVRRGPHTRRKEAAAKR